MRNRALVTAVVLLAVGGGCAESVATSPECERWVADYHEKLAQSQPVKSFNSHKEHLKRYVHRQIALVTHKPAHSPVVAAKDPLHPRISPAQLVRRFEIMCGDLPPVETAQLIPAEIAPPLAPAALSTSVPAPTVATASISPALPGSPIFPGGGSPGTPGIPGVPSQPSTPSSPPTTPPTGHPPTTNPPTDTLPPGPPTPPPLPPVQPPTGPAAPPVPEPGTVVLTLTGMLVMAGYSAMRRVGVWT